MRARIDGKLFSLDDHDAFLWAVNGTALVVQAVPGTLGLAGNQWINIQIGNYRGPGAYALEETTNPGPISAGSYGVIAGQPPVTVQSFSTMGPYKGSVRIIAEDTTLGAIVGTFEFSAGASTGTGEVHITQGSFRIRR